MLEQIHLRRHLRLDQGLVAQNRVSAAAPGAGRIGFQLEGTAYELRNVHLTPLD